MAGDLSWFIVNLNVCVTGGTRGFVPTYFMWLGIGCVIVLSTMAGDLSGFIINLNVYVNGHP